jgi:hypothetical protein
MSRISPAACTALVVMLCAPGCTRRIGPNPYVVEVNLQPEITALGSEDLLESEPALERIASLGPAVVPALDAALLHEATAVRVGVVEALGQIDDPRIIPLLVRTAGDAGDVEVRYVALQGLGARGDPQAAPVVEAALGDPDPKIRLAAASACAVLCASPTALAALVEGTLQDPWPNFVAGRISLVGILAGRGRAGAEDGRAAIEAMALPVIGGGGLADEEGRAALLASDIGDASGAQSLARLVGDAANPALRLYAIHALGTVGSGEAVRPLARQLSDPAAAAYACDALNRMANRGVVGARTALRGHAARCPSKPLPPPYRLAS